MDSKAHALRLLMTLADVSCGRHEEEQRDVRGSRRRVCEAEVPEHVLLVRECLSERPEHGEHLHLA